MNCPHPMFGVAGLIATECIVSTRIISAGDFLKQVAKIGTARRSQFQSGNRVGVNASISHINLYTGLVVPVPILPFFNTFQSITGIKTVTISYFKNPVVAFILTDQGYRKIIERSHAHDPNAVGCV